MLDAMDDLMKVDVEMCQAFGDPIPRKMAPSVIPAPVPIMGQGVSMMGLDFKSSRGLEMPAAGQGVSMMGLNLGKKGEMHGDGIRVTADVIQPVNPMPGMSSDTETFRQQLIDAGFVRATQVSCRALCAPLPCHTSRRALDFLLCPRCLPPSQDISNIA
jgi:hypothetical protein